MPLSKEYSPEKLNYFRICYITTEIITAGLRKVFKHEWNTHYKGKYDAWEDTAQNGIDFYNNESVKSRKKNSRELDILKTGNTLECDCTCLFFAILYSDSVRRGLDPAVKKGVNDLRVFRNECFAHLSSGELTEAEFQTSIQNVITAFTTLKLDTSDIEEVRNQKMFPIKELRVTQELLEKEKMRNEEPQPFCVLPPKPSHQVFHREEEIKSILQEMEKLRSTKPNEITVIYLSGNPGSGKSEIARQIGEKVFDDVPDKETEAKFVFALNASSIDALIESYVEFAVSLKCDENSTTSIGTSKDLSEEDKLIYLKSLVAPKLRKYSSWLLIVDNVTDLKSVFRYLPKAGEKIDGKGQILVTTQDSRSIADDCYTYHLSLSRGMNHDEVTRMLWVISGIAADDEIKFQVAKALDMQPLALACAATYMRHVRMTTPTFSWQEYLQKLQKGKREVTEGEYQKTSVAYSQTMTAVVKLAIEKEVEENAIMLHAFNFLSVMAPETIPLEYVVQYVTRSMPDEDKEDVAANVTSSSLILSSEGQSQEIRIHQVVHGFLNTIVRPQMNEIEEFYFLLNVIQAFSILLDSFDENNVNAIMATNSLVVHFVLISKKLSRLYLTNSNSILEIPFSQEDNRLHCLFSTGRICEMYGKYEEAHNLFKITLIIKEKIYGKNHPALTSTLNGLGISLYHLDQQKETKTYIERALAIQEIASDPNHSATLSNLGNSLGGLEQYREARTYFERALAIEETAFGQNHSAVASTLSNLSNILSDLGKHEEAKSCLERALAIEEMVFGQNHSAVASTLSNLSNILGDLGKHEEAKSCLERALAIKEKILHTNHPDLAFTFMNLGKVLRDLGKHEEAKSCLERALAIEEMVFGPDHPDLASTLRNLGNILGDLGKHEEAKSCLERALAIEEMNFGPNHQDLASTLRNLGKVLRDLGKHEEAKCCLERELAIEEMVLGPNHTDLASTLRNLGDVLDDLGKHEEAKSCLERALAIEKMGFSDNHPDLA